MAYGLFITCLADTLTPDVGRATVRVLERAGVELEFPREQTCCGQLHFNAGHVDEARRLARRFVELFDPYETIVAPSGSCAAHVRTHVPTLLSDDRGVPARTRELSEFLIEQVGAVDVGSTYRGSLAYHPTCHSLRLLELGDRPVSLLRAVPGVEVVELSDAEECCGFGGTFAVKNADVSAAMLDAKIESILASGADAVCACDASCLMHIGGGLRRRGSQVRAVASRGGARLVTQAERAARPESFPHAAREALASRQMRANVLHATTTIRAKRALAVAEVPDWEELRAAGAAIKDHALLSLERLLVELEGAVASRGGTVHWARDAAEANAVVTTIVHGEGENEIVKVKSLTTDEIGLNDALEAGGDPRAGDRPRRADRAAGRGAAVAPAGARNPQEQDGDPGPLPGAARAR